MPPSVHNALTVTCNDFWTTDHERIKCNLRQKTGQVYAMQNFLPRALSFVTSVFNCIFFISHPFPAHLTIQIFLKGSQYVFHLYRYIQEDKNLKIFYIFSDLCRNGHLNKTD